MSRKLLLTISIAVCTVWALFVVGKNLLRPALTPDITFTLLSGEKVSKADLRGKVAVIHFWATSCTTCIQEMPKLIRVYEQLRANAFGGEKFEMIAVTMAYDPPMYVTHYAQTRKLPFKVSMDSGGLIAKAFGEVRLTPTTFIIDQQGRIIKQYLGEPNWAQFQKILEESLKKST